MQNELTFIDEITIKILKKRIEEVQPKLVCFLFHFREFIQRFPLCSIHKSQFSECKKRQWVAVFPNTELRELKDQRVFEFFDFITLE